MKEFGVRSFLLATAMLAASPLCAAPVAHLLTMDDLPTQPVHGLAHPTGVEFGFTVGGVPSALANYASNGPGPITYVQDPSIEGTSAGILFVSFPEPASIVRFGLARSVTNSSNATVELFDQSNALLGTANLALTPSPFFAEAQFVHQGQAVSRFTLAFSGPESRFAFDNLFFQIIPEPTSCALAAIGATCGMAMSARRRLFANSSHPAGTN